MLMILEIQCNKINLLHKKLHLVTSYVKNSENKKISEEVKAS